MKRFMQEKCGENCTLYNVTQKASYGTPEGT